MASTKEAKKTKAEKEEEALSSMQSYLLQISTLSDNTNVSDAVPATYKAGNSHIVVFLFKVQIIDSVIFVSAAEIPNGYSAYLLAWSLIIKRVAYMQHPQIKINYDSLPEEYKKLYKKYKDFSDKKIKKQLNDESHIELTLNLQKAVAITQEKARKKIFGIIPLFQLKK